MKTSKIKTRKIWIGWKIPKISIVKVCNGRTSIEFSSVTF